MNVIQRFKSALFKPKQARHMSLFARAKNAVLKPQHFWVIVSAEQASLSGLYLNYLFILAAIPAVCALLGMVVVGVGGFTVTSKVPFLFAFLVAFVSYLLSLVMIYVLSLAINALAPSFDGKSDSLRAFKLAAYASTAPLLGGVFGLFPALSILTLLCALYGVYLMYLGLPVLMRNPREKSFAYTLILFPVAFATGAVMFVCVAMVSSLFSPDATRLNPNSDAYIVLKAPDNTLKVPGIKRPEESQKHIDSIQQSAGATNLLPISPEVLKGFLPAQVGPLVQTSIEVATITGNTPVSVARADYEVGHQKVVITITDTGGLTNESLPQHRDSGRFVEKTWQEGGRIIYQKFDSLGGSAVHKIFLRNGVVVLMEGTRVSADLLKSLSFKLELKALESFSRNKKS